MPTTDLGYTAHTVTARRPFQCQGYLCRHQIAAGEDYARHVAFPGSDVCEGPAPWVLRICRVCHTEHGQEMPPRRRSTALPAPVVEETTDAR